jgi:hypothetical protein
VFPAALGAWAGPHAADRGPGSSATCMYQTLLVPSSKPQHLPPKPQLFAAATSGHDGDRTIATGSHRVGKIASNLFSKSHYFKYPGQMPTCAETLGWARGALFLERPHCDPTPVPIDSRNNGPLCGPTGRLAPAHGWQHGTNALLSLSGQCREAVNPPFGWLLRLVVFRVRV